MKKLNKIPLKVSVYIRYIYQDKGVRGKLLLDKFPQYSKASIYRHAKRPIDEEKFDKRCLNRGRPASLGERDKRNILRQVHVLRNNEGSSFTVKRIRVAAGIDPSISHMTIRRCLHGAGYGYRRAWKKGLLSQKDLAIRLKFCRKVKRKLSEKVWKTGICFYLDGTGFTHKYNPHDQGRCTKSMAWRKANEGLSAECTTKGSHEGTGGKVAHFMVAVAYDKGVVLCEQYKGNINGEKFADFIRDNFKEALEKGANPRGKLFLQDGDPSQNSKKARDAWEDIGARKFTIPPRSPDLNPIENIFNVVKRGLSEDAVKNNITKENFDEFSIRVKASIENTSCQLINKTIDTMNKRVDMIIKAKGQRIKY